jgi:hypothetical protein
MKVFQNCVIDTYCINSFLFFVSLQEKVSFLIFAQTPDTDGTVIQHTGGQWKAVMQTGFYFSMLMANCMLLNLGPWKPDVLERLVVSQMAEKLHAFF